MIRYPFLKVTLISNLLSNPIKMTFVAKKPIWAEFFLLSLTSFNNLLVFATPIRRFVSYNITSPGATSPVPGMKFYWYEIFLIEFTIHYSSKSFEILLKKLHGIDVPIWHKVLGFVVPIIPKHRAPLETFMINTFFYRFVLKIQTNLNTKISKT